QRLSTGGPLRRLLMRLGGDLAVHPDTRRMADEVAALLRDLPAGRAITVEHRPQRDWPLPMKDIESEVSAALEPPVDLASGAWLLFEPGQTLTAVDVNSGTTRGTAGERLWLKTNLEAAKEIARQLRLRHIGGIVVVDFIDLKDAMARRQVGEAL